MSQPEGFSLAAKFIQISSSAILRIEVTFSHSQNRLNEVYNSLCQKYHNNLCISLGSPRDLFVKIQDGPNLNLNPF
uniref:Uncharacterized protein n=1 Tax=Lepeophtheirus salmonis TaxID=72036 RepID=A0A0K2VD86_LEPSM